MVDSPRTETLTVEPFDSESDLSPQRWAADVARISLDRIVSMIGRVGEDFQRVFAPGDNASHRLFTALQGRFFLLGTPPSPDGISAVELTPNDYIERLGIGLVSVKVGVKDLAGRDLRFEDESADPTIGVIPANMESPEKPEIRGEPASHVLACFPVTEGAEKLIVLSDELHARGFLPGERMDVDQAIAPWSCEGRPTIVPQSCVVGVRVPFLSKKRADEAGLKYLGVITPEEMMAQFHRELGPASGEVYMCRYLTQAAVLEAMRFGKYLRDLASAREPAAK